MKQRTWVIAERLATDLTEHLLLSRLNRTGSARDQFLAPSLDNLSQPDAFLGMKDAVARIIQAIQNNKSIVVWGDFDADGVTSTAIMWETLHQLGASVMPYIPNRDTEGHGFSPVGVQKLIDDQVELVITVDHGITAIEEIDALAEQGIDVVVTDHHEPKREEANLRDEKNAKLAEGNNENIQQSSYPAIQQSDEFILPNAVAVIHPILMDKPQPYAGCGVAYMVAYAVWLQFKGLKDNNASRHEFAQDKIELAAIGTIADMVPLHEDNRIIATVGLQALVKTKRRGLQQMYKLAGFQDKSQFGSYEVGFGIGPRLNAPGRLGDALESLRLLCSKDAVRANQLAQNLDDLNRQRQDLLAQVAEEAKTEVIKHADGVYVLAKSNWPAGVCGLAAGKIVENFYRPTVVMECMGELSRGSARSIPGYDFTAALSSIAELLESYGGHAMAAGFIAKTDNLPIIEQRLTEILWQKFDKESLVPQLKIDAEITLESLTWDLHKFIGQLEPFGMGNPKPIFASRNLQVVDFRAVGGGGKHLKISLAENRDKTSTAMDGIAFGLGYLSEKLTTGANVDVAYQLDENVWQNRRSLQLMIKDVRVIEKSTTPQD